MRASFVREHGGRKNEITYLVVPVLEPPLDVRRRGVVDVLLDVVERVLADIRDPQVVVDEEAAIGRVARLGVADDHLHQGGLAGAVGPDQANAGT